jgi:hypothetical protein
MFGLLIVVRIFIDIIVIEQELISEINSDEAEASDGEYDRGEDCGIG